MVQTKVADQIKTHALYSVTFFFENRSFYEVKRKNIVERGMPQMTIWHMRLACRIAKATNTHLEYVIIIIAFPLEQSLHERASFLD
jgi:hypothetical protein